MKKLILLIPIFLFTSCMYFLSNDAIDKCIERCNKQGLLVRRAGSVTNEDESVSFSCECKNRSEVCYEICEKSGQLIKSFSYDPSTGKTSCECKNKD